MRDVISRKFPTRAAATTLGAQLLAPLAIGLFLARAALAGTETNQQPFPSRADQEKRPAETAPKERSKTGGGDEKSIAEKAAHYEAVHQERMARIRRLLGIYKEKGETEKVAELQTMRDKLEKRHTNAMQKFREQLGEDRWTKVENHIRTRKAERTPADVRKPAEARPQEKPQERPAEKPPEKKRPAPPR